MAEYNKINELLFTTIQTAKLRNNIENNMSVNIKLSKAQIKKIIMSGEALRSISGKLIAPLTKIATKILLTSGLTAAMSAIDAGVQKKKYMVLEQL